MRKQILKIAALAMLPLCGLAQAQALCEGDAVTTPNHRNAIVLQVFPDGQAKIRIENSRRDYDFYRTSSLSTPISCFQNICANDFVTTPDHRNAIVLQVFPDGQAKIRIENSRRDYDFYFTSQLALYRRCSQVSGATNCNQ